MEKNGSWKKSKVNESMNLSEFLNVAKAVLLSKKSL